jgi:hypothetical protein
LGENHPRFHRAVDNQVLKEIQERYPLPSPLTDLWKKRVKKEANFNPSGTRTIIWPTDLMR